MLTPDRIDPPSTPKAQETTSLPKMLSILGEEGRLPFLKALEDKVPLHEGGRICAFLEEQVDAFLFAKIGISPLVATNMENVKIALHNDSRLKNITNLDYKFGLIVTELQERIAP